MEDFPYPRSYAKPEGRIGRNTALYGLVVGPFTLALHRGTNLFLDMFDQPETVKELIDFCRQVTEQVAEYYIDAGMDVIAVVDPMISQISADHFQEFVSKAASHIFDFIRQKGACSSFFVCGNATPVLEVMAQCRPDGISIDENVNLEYAKEIADRYQISYGGNIPLTTVMLLGSQADNMAKALELMDAHKGRAISSRRAAIYPIMCLQRMSVPSAWRSLTQREARVFVETNKDDSAAADVEIEMPDYDSLRSSNRSADSRFSYLSAVQVHG